MRTFLPWLWTFVWFIAVGVATQVLFNWWSAEQQSLWVGAARGFLFFLAVPVFAYCERRGWIKGYGWHREQHAQRRKELAAEREQILADAKAKRSG